MTRPLRQAALAAEVADHLRMRRTQALHRAMGTPVEAVVLAEATETLVQGMATLAEAMATRSHTGRTATRRRQHRLATQLCRLP
jgi:hypothetical protein